MTWGCPPGPIQLQEYVISAPCVMVVTSGLRSIRYSALASNPDSGSWGWPTPMPLPARRGGTFRYYDLLHPLHPQVRQRAKIQERIARLRVRDDLIDVRLQPVPGEVVEVLGVDAPRARDYLRGLAEEVEQRSGRLIIECPANRGGERPGQQVL